MSSTWLTWLGPTADVPEQLNSPFDVGTPHPLVQQAVDAVQATLRAGHLAPGLSTSLLETEAGGKMFGVLVVRAEDGRLGFLKSFSGQLDQRWDVEGYVPPVFDRAARAEFEPVAERVVKALTERVEAARAEPTERVLRGHLLELETESKSQVAALRAVHLSNKQERDRRRQQGASDAAAALARESQRDDLELRALRKSFADRRAVIEADLFRVLRRMNAIERLRRIVSQEVVRRLYDTYVFENARGHVRSLRALFEPKLPSSGTGDCAAPKLLAFAHKIGLEPLGLAEFWWGAAPPGGGRTQGSLYPACKDKCGPLLPFLLDGLEVAESRRFKPRALNGEALRVHFEDEHLVVVEKPEGLLSVPGTDASVTDSVLARMRARYPNATGPLVVHRLDLETSGVMVVALRHEVFVAVQRQFIERTVEKRYLAVLAGLIERDEGVINLPLRVDLEQRPRQLVDFEHGKPATTWFRVLERASGRTRVHFFPKTGRTHQLRVHAAHAQGLATPIVGDRLYGVPTTRLLLHAESLVLTHPVTGERLEVVAAAPF